MYIYNTLYICILTIVQHVSISLAMPQYMYIPINHCFIPYLYYLIDTYKKWLEMLAREFQKTYLSI